MLGIRLVWAVIDPGVGGIRAPGVLEADGRWFVGPDNGLFEVVARRCDGTPQWWNILWRPDRLSETFHGRDLFAPIAARLARGETPRRGGDDFEDAPLERIQRLDWPDDLAEIVYIDGFGNAMTGIRFPKTRNYPLPDNPYGASKSFPMSQKVICCVMKMPMGCWKYPSTKAERTRC